MSAYTILNLEGWPKLLIDFDFAYDIAVEFLQVVGRDPIFSILFATDLMNFVSRQKLLASAKSQDVSDVFRLRVPSIPIAGNLHGISFIQNRIENRLAC